MDPLKTEKFQSLIPKMIESGCKSSEILRECGIRKKNRKDPWKMLKNIFKRPLKSLRNPSKNPSKDPDKNPSKIPSKSF